MKIIQKLAYRSANCDNCSNRQTVFFIRMVLMLLVLCTFSACTTRKNTKVTRKYHDITAHYNVYFNGNESLKMGNIKLKNDYKEDYSKILPIFRYEHPETATLLGSDMDRTIKKSAKTIKLHSITVKPKVKKKNLTREEQIFLTKAEYCKWIDNAYLIMAKAYFLKREYETAKQILFLVINKYKSEDTKYEAMLWLAKTYAQLEEYNSAENTLIDLHKAKKYDKRFKLQINLVYASMFLKQDKYTEAAKKLRKVIDLERDKQEKIRYLFILAQIYQYTDKHKQAEEYYKKVIKRNPDYDMAFIAKIRLAEIFERHGGNALELKKQLLKMSRDEKNIDYLDQIYYALGKIELNEKNYEKAVEYFMRSSQSMSSNNTQKVRTYVALAEYYYDKEDLMLSKAYYDSVYNAIEPTFPDYKKIYSQIENRHKLTNELYTVVEEDSLQKVAKMDEAKRNELINKMIEKIVEQEAKQKAAASNNNMAYDPIFDSNYGRTTNPMQGGKYYFYNTSTLSFGMTEFRKKWGDRRLGDNWRRSNKQVNADDSEVENGKRNKSSVVANADSTQSVGNKIVTNVKSREYYLQNLPLTKEKMAASNQKIQDALFKSARIYEKDMNEVAKAIKQYQILLKRFPKTEYRKEALYSLYNLYTNELDKVNADKYKDLIIRDFPKSVYAQLLKDPEYAAKLISDEKVAEKLYETTVTEYKSGQFQQCIQHADNAIATHPNSDLVPNFIYIKALSFGEMGNHDELRKYLEIIIKEYPDNELIASAKGIVAVLNSGKFKEDLYKINKDTLHYFVMIFKPKGIDQKELAFKFKAFNLDNYTQDELKVNIIEFKDGQDMLIVRSLQNGRQAEMYYQQIVNSMFFAEYKQNISSLFLITPQNYQEFIKNKIIKKYIDFYYKNYATAKQLLD